MTAPRCTCIGAFVRGVWVVEVTDPACRATHEATSCPCPTRIAHEPHVWTSWVDSGAKPTLGSLSCPGVAS